MRRQRPITGAGPRQPGSVRVVMSRVTFLGSTGCAATACPVIYPESRACRGRRALLADGGTETATPIGPTSRRSPGSGQRRRGQRLARRTECPVPAWLPCRVHVPVVIFAIPVHHRLSCARPRPRTRTGSARRALSGHCPVSQRTPVEAQYQRVNAGRCPNCEGGLAWRSEAEIPSRPAGVGIAHSWLPWTSASPSGVHLSRGVPWQCQ
jgi:hypothetical protein